MSIQEQLLLHRLPIKLGIAFFHSCSLLDSGGLGKLKYSFLPKRGYEEEEGVEMELKGVLLLLLLLLLEMERFNIEWAILVCEGGGEIDPMRDE
jgi:hypothetical protein